MNITLYDRVGLGIAAASSPSPFMRPPTALSRTTSATTPPDQLGRVSFNPLRHIDPFGTLILPAMLLLSHSPFLFGYAKPVPVNFRTFAIRGSTWSGWRWPGPPPISSWR